MTAPRRRPGQCAGQWHLQGQVGVEHARARGALAVGFLGRRQRAECASAWLPGQARFQRAAADKLLVRHAEREAAHAAALHRHLGVVDEIAAVPLVGAHRQRRLARGVAVDKPRGLELSAGAGAAVDVVLVGAGHSLVITVVVQLQRDQPVMPRQRIVDGGASRAVVGCGAATGQVTVARDVEQVVQAGRIVDGDGEAGLVGTGGAAAAVVHRHAGAQLASALPLDQQVTFTRLLDRHDLDVGLGAGHPLEVFQALFDRAQVQ